MDNSIEDILDVLLRNTTTFSIEEIKNNLDTILHGILNAIENNDFQHVWDIKINDGDGGIGNIKFFISESIDLLNNMSFKQKIEKIIETINNSYNEISSKFVLRLTKEQENNLSHICKKEWENINDDERKHVNNDFQYFYRSVYSLANFMQNRYGSLSEDNKIVCDFAKKQLDYIYSDYVLYPITLSVLDTYAKFLNLDSVSASIPRIFSCTKYPIMISYGKSLI